MKHHFNSLFFNYFMFIKLIIMMVVIEGIIIILDLRFTFLFFFRYAIILFTESTRGAPIPYNYNSFFL